VLATLVLGPGQGILKQTRRHEVNALGAVWLVFGAKLRRRWPSWLAIVILIGVVGGFVLAAVAAGRRTESAFPRFVAAYGFDAYVYATRPLPQLAKLPGSSPSRSCTARSMVHRRATALTRSTLRTLASSSHHPGEERSSSSYRDTCLTRRHSIKCWHRSPFKRTMECISGP
jgi:hypothetical protein